jgi:2-polyprenyl-3-methyl-5-hydroxy-6-metoxy-1,4-benzoquinol methylase
LVKSTTRNASAISEIERHHHDEIAAKFSSRKRMSWLRSYSCDPLWSEIQPLLVGKEVLDVGCGMGFCSVILASLGYSVRGVDISPKSIEWARILAETSGVSDRCMFEVVDLNSSPVEGDYDTIFGRAVLHHLTVKPLGETLLMLRSHLRKEGRMVFQEPLALNPIVNLNRDVFDTEDRTPTERPLDLWQTLQSFRSAGLYLTHKEYYLTAPLAHFFKKVCKFDPMFWSTQRSLSRLDSLLTSTFWPLRPYSWITLLSAHQ